MKADRDISKLDPAFLLKVTSFLQDQRIKEIGIIVTEAVRSSERQAQLYKSGASQVKHSNHQDGLAIDFCFSGGLAYPSINNPKWKAVSDIATEYGIDSGLKLWNWDACHLQTNGLPLTNTDMNLKEEFFKNSIEITILSNSNLWKATDNPELRKKLEEQNSYLRSLKD